MVDTAIYLIIDGSGSMSGVKNEVVDGVNDFIKEQQDDTLNQGSTTVLSLTVFDSVVKQVYVAEDISLVNPVTVSDTFLGGGTALLDAVGKTLSVAEDNQATRNLVVIYTDGQENQSREFTKEQVGDLLDKFDKTGKWQIIYLGAEFADFKKDQAYAAVHTNSTSSLNTSKANTRKVFASVSGTANYYRGATAQDLAGIRTEGVVAMAASADAVDWDDVREEENLEPKKITRSKKNVGTK